MDYKNSFAVQDEINCYKNRILFEENWRLKIKQSEGEMRFNLTRADINNNSETRRQFSRFSQNQILSKKSHQNVQNYAMSFNRAISIAF